jgi:serine/threonine-protein kinase
MIRLLFVSGPAKGQRREVAGDITIGRHGSNDVALADDAVSLVHCRVFLENGRFFVKDLGSTNGVRVNGLRVPSCELHDGDEITLGTSGIRIEMPQAPAEAATQAAPGQPAATHHPMPGEGEDISGSVSYHLVRHIATGGMGSIYEAEQLGAEGFLRRVAIKTILPEFARQENFVTSFVGEARLVANLVQQNIVQIHHLGRHGEGYYIAMEYVDGLNLSAFLRWHRERKRPVPVEIATYIVSRICRGLEYAHGKKDEHGAREGEVKLADFGVAKARQYMEDDEEYLVGSVEYMSPEQAECCAVDARSDLFSLGLVYFELLTGVRVFRCRDGDLEAARQAVVACRVPDPRKYRPDLDRETAEIVLKCLCRLPSERWPSAGDLCYGLEYSIYHDGYGPTPASLSRYLGETGMLTGIGG